MTTMLGRWPAADSDTFAAPVNMDASKQTRITPTVDATIRNPRRCRPIDAMNDDSE
jgi:hypothetical protein